MPEKVPDHPSSTCPDLAVVAVSSVEGRMSWRQAGLLWICCYFGNLAGAILVALLLPGAGSLGQLPPDHALFDGALRKAQQTGSVISSKVFWPIGLFVWLCG